MSIQRILYSWCSNASASIVYEELVMLKQMQEYYSWQRKFLNDWGTSGYSEKDISEFIEECQTVLRKLNTSEIDEAVKIEVATLKETVNDILVILKG